ncbi:hypothetical protein [uncultured Psychroserpens sp.]|uniref:hypothetical protein n=1 Tax=uncultured Psychroserpens sp. TaxID=255436 RepID=UPI0026099905|nr:hypothetical protein [uncultured Psychroserpens sp.]
MNQKEFDIIKTTKEGLVKPQDFGIKPKYCSSILMRGYVTSYKIDSDLNLILNNFCVNVNMNDDIKFVNGIPPHISSKTDIKSGTTFREYRDPNLPVEYSGYILIGHKIIKLLDTKYRLYGADYEEVIELSVKKGKVISINNLSEKMLQHKMKFKDGDWELDIQNTTFDNEILKWLFKDIEF